MNEKDMTGLGTLLKLAIEEDIKNGDITSRAIFPDDHLSKAVIIAKGKGVFCGGEVIKYCYSVIDKHILIKPRKADGNILDAGDTVTELEGPTRSILGGERIVLNFIQRMSGIATETARLTKMMEGSGIAILDTRKTLPGFRHMDKYAVKTGGGTNHRMGLYDMVMIKDNHIKAAGSIRAAVEMVRSAYGTSYKIEVEATDVKEATEAAEAGADIIMLDNMDTDGLRESVNIINKRAQIEVSGNITGEKLRELKDLGIDFISIGALTHSVRAFDFSMKFIDN